MDLKARCIAAALMISYGVRSNAAVTLHHRETQRSLTVLGERVKQLRADERRIAELIQGTLCLAELEGLGHSKTEGLVDGKTKISRECGESSDKECVSIKLAREKQQRHDERQALALKKKWESRRAHSGSSCGFFVHDADDLGKCLGRYGCEEPDLVKKLVLLIVEDGMSWEELLATGLVQEAAQVVMMLGDNVGLLEEEHCSAQDLDAVCVRLGDMPMLTSQCITVLNYLLDRQKQSQTSWHGTKDARVFEYVKGDGKNCKILQPAAKKPEGGCMGLAPQKKGAWIVMGLGKFAVCLSLLWAALQFLRKRKSLRPI